MAILLRTKNCGVVEMHGLAAHSDPLTALKSIAPVLKIGVTWPFEVERATTPLVAGLVKNHPYSFVIFTGITHAGGKPLAPTANYGARFASFLRQNKLGKVTTLQPRLNWTTKHIQVWLWAPDYNKLWPFLETQNANTATPFAP